MTAKQSIEYRTVTCPACEVASVAAIVPATEPGWTHSDFRVGPPAASPLAHESHLCDACGYTAPVADWETFDAELVPEAEAVERLRDRTADLRRALEHTTDSRERAMLLTEASVITSEVLDGSDYFLGNHMLRAMWACANAGDHEAERYWRRRTIMVFTQAMEQFDAVPTDEQATCAYLIGELARRNGDADLADAWFAAVVDVVERTGAGHLVLPHAHRQRTAPSEYLSPPKDLVEVPGQNPRV